MLVFAAGYGLALKSGGWRSQAPAALGEGAVPAGSSRPAAQARGGQPPVGQQATAEAQAVSETEPSVASAPAGPPIEPGMWTLTIELVDVVSADPAYPDFRFEDPGIGRRETATLCVTPAVARDPAAAGFPFGLENECRPGSLIMRDNRYRGRMSCYFDDLSSGWRPIDVDGTYSRTGVSLRSRVRSPVEGGFEGPEELDSHYRVEGRRTGSC
jgi:hypothetical protein